MVVIKWLHFLIYSSQPRDRSCYHPYITDGKTGSHKLNNFPQVPQVIRTERTVGPQCGVVSGRFYRFSWVDRQRERH